MRYLELLARGLGAWALLAAVFAFGWAVGARLRVWHRWRRSMRAAEDVRARRERLRCVPRWDQVAEEKGHYSRRET